MASDDMVRSESYKFKDEDVNRGVSVDVEDEFTIMMQVGSTQASYVIDALVDNPSPRYLSRGGNDKYSYISYNT